MDPWCGDVAKGAGNGTWIDVYSADAFNIHGGKFSGGETTFSFGEGTATFGGVFGCLISGVTIGSVVNGIVLVSPTDLIDLHEHANQYFSVTNKFTGDLTQSRGMWSFGSTDNNIQYNNIVTTGRLFTMPSDSTSAGFNLPPGAAPSSPSNGDMWTTTVGLYVRINGVTVGPLT